YIAVTAAPGVPSGKQRRDKLGIINKLRAACKPSRLNKFDCKPARCDGARAKHPKDPARVHRSRARGSRSNAYLELADRCDCSIGALPPECYKSNEWIRCSRGTALLGAC